MRLRRGKVVNARTIYDKRPVIVEEDIAKIPIGLNAKHGYAIVDREFAWIDKYNWSISHGYATSQLGLMHHIIIGKPKKGFHIDHINHNKLDNRKSNLREITPQQNQMNSTSKQKFKGVTKDGQRWKAQLMFNRKHINVGRYNTPDEAALAYNKIATEYFGEYAHLNDI